MNNKIKILIADDHPLLRGGVRKELETFDNFNVIAEASDGQEALELIIRLQPDVAILDFQMPKMTGIEIARELTESNSNTNVILLTMHRDKKILYSALDAGVKGYVLKDDTVTDIIKAVNVVVSGEYFISGSLTPALIERTKNSKNPDTLEGLINTLTAMEKKILLLISELKNNQEIADELFISKRTVENHKVNMSDKLNMKSRELLKFTIENKEFLS